MRTFVAAGLVVAVLGVAVGQEKKKDPTAGKWVVESVTRDGKADDELKGAVRIHEAGKYSITPAGKTESLKGTYTADGDKTPATIDMKPSGGRYKDKTLLGIVKVEGDTMTIAFAEPDKDRPAAFESKPGSGVVVAVHKRAK